MPDSCGRKPEGLEETHVEEMVTHPPTYITNNILVELFSPRQLDLSVLPLRTHITKYINIATIYIHISVEVIIYNRQVRNEIELDPEFRIEICEAIFF